jgi:hypothetical protein
MTPSPVLTEIARAAQQLKPEQQQQVLDYIRAIGARPPGNRPTEILQIAGSIPLEDCIEMEKAIEEGCERVDTDGW